NALKDDKLTTARQEAQMNLESAGEIAVPALIVALRSDNSAQRANSADMLGYIASPTATDALRTALQSDAVPAVRRNAAWALGEIKSPSAIGDLLQASITDRSAIVRGAAADSLARIRTTLAQSADMNEQFIGAFANAPAKANLIYVAAQRDLHMSNDGGATWTQLSNVLPSQISALAVNPSNAQELFAGVDSMGIYKSTDGGKTWQAVNTGITLTPGARDAISAIAIDPENPTVIYVARGVWLGTSKVEFHPTGLMYSRDNGATWQALNAGSSGEAIDQLAFREGQLYGLAGDRVLTLVTPR
ncbi:MAG TPA: HEAT repeat domain-containing protein, partial [Anaerolineae bacterium]|nr:HEAT repeat domain-containing protein [Anaerolineae bacterium]